MARENYPLIRQLDLVERTKDFTLNNADKGYLPQLSFSGKATYQSDVTTIPVLVPGLEKGMEKDQYQLVAEVNQSLWDGGVIRNRKEQAQAEAAVQRQQIEVGLYALNDRVNQLYFGVLLIEARLKQNALLQKQLALNHGQVQAYVQQGVALPADLDAVKVEQLNARQAEKEMQMSRRAYMEVLGLLIGKKDMEQVVLDCPVAREETLAESRRPELTLYELQRRQLAVKRKGLTAGSMPKFGVFLQGGYGDPGLNMLKGGFEPYYIAGIRFTWNLGSLYTRKNDKRILSMAGEEVNVQQDLFLLNSRMEYAGQRREVEKLRLLMDDDEELIRLRTRIREAAEAKVANGTLTVAEMLREVTAEDQARQTKALHEVQLLQAVYRMKYIMNHE